MRRPIPLTPNLQTDRVSHRPLTTLLLKKQSWLRYCKRHGDDVRDTEIENVTKVIACGTLAMGCKEYVCSDPCCPEKRLIKFSCHSRFCPTCGNKSTQMWLEAQKAILPNCDYQHAVFTFPEEIGKLFHAKANRWLLSKLIQCAANVLLKLAKERGITVGLFAALHTFGRRLTWHVHTHASVTAGGLNENGEWVEVEFEDWELVQPWKDEIAALLRKYYGHLFIPKSLQSLFGSYERLDRYLTGQCESSVYWHLYIDKKTDGKKRTLSYIGRYIRRPPVSASRLRHYNAKGDIQFNYLDHKTGKYVREIVSVDEMLERLITHIPEKHFKGIRFYGFLSNRHRKTILAKVYEALGDFPGEVEEVTYATLSKSYRGVDPYVCILCGKPMLFNEMYVGNSVRKLVANWEKFAAGYTL